MPFERTWEEKGIYFKPYGVATGKDIEKLTIDIYGDHRFDDIRYAILNFLYIGDFIMSDEELESVAAQDMAAAITNPYIKIAVVTNDPRVEDVANRFNNMFGGHPWKTSCHENLEEARKWCQGT